jgi:hypothetical protein
MNDDLKAAANANGLPFEKFLQDYSKAVTTEQAMKAGRDIAKKVQNSARNIPMDETLKYGDRTLSGAKLDKLDTDFEEARRGIDFTRLQEKAIHGAQEDKRVSNILATGGAPGNSQTGQNLAMDTLLSHYLVDSLMGDRKGGVARQATRSVLSAPMTWANKVIGKPARDEILRRVAKGMLDPEEARRLMTLGDLTSGVTFGDSLKGGLVGEITRRATQ